MNNQRLLVLFAIALLLAGCSTSLAKEPYFKDHIGARHELTERMYLGRVRKHLPVGIVDIIQKHGPPHIMFKKDLVSFFAESDVFEGEIVQLDIGTPLQIEDMIYRNRIDSDDYYACGKVRHPVTGAYVQFQYRLDIRTEVHPNKNPSKIMRFLFLSKRSDTVTTILEKMPWEEENTPERTIDEINLYY